MKTPVVLVLAMAIVGLAPAPAHAERLVTPFGGLTFGGDTTQHKPLVGAAVTVLGKKSGIEIELAGAPGFFDARGDSHTISTVMGRIIIGGRTRGHGLRPFVSIGAGVMRARVESSSLFSDVLVNDLTLDAGGGVHWFFIPNVGLRGDVRYVRTFGSGDDDIPVSNGFGFWRSTVGVAFLF